MTARKRRGRTRLERLRSSVDALPPAARAAMLDGLDEDTIVAGAYVGPGGTGSCPMVAVHRRGVRTEANRFARAWDEFCGVAHGGARQATERELGVLRALLEASLLADEHVDLHGALAEHQSMARARRAREAAATGTAWLRDAAAVSCRPRCPDAAPAVPDPDAARLGAPAVAHG